LKKALDMGYDAPEMYAALAMSFADAPEQPGDLEQALKYADQAEERGDHGTLTLYARGLANQRLNRFPEAIRAYEAVLAQDRTASGAWLGLSQSFRAEGNAKKADELAEMGEKVLAERQRTIRMARDVQNDPDRLDLRERYAKVLLSQNKFLEAANELRFVAKHRPGDPGIWRQVANAMDKGGSHDMAKYLRDYAAQAERDKANGKAPAPAPEESLPSGSASVKR
jgi:tetratricopeptide (TPR) repeat protein